MCTCVPVYVNVDRYMYFCDLLLWQNSCLHVLPLHSFGTRLVCLLKNWYEFKFLLTARFTKLGQNQLLFILVQDSGSVFSRWGGALSIFVSGV